MKVICVDMKKRGCEDVKTTCVVGVKMGRRVDVKMYTRPRLLEEPFAQKLSGKNACCMSDTSVLSNTKIVKIL